MDNQWSLIFFTAFVGLGSGTLVAVGASEWWNEDAAVRRRAGILALVALVVGGLSSVLHLGHPERIFGALGHPTSGIFLEALMIGLTGLCAVAYLLAQSRQASRQARRNIAALGAVLAAILAFAVGDTYVMPSRPAWDSLLLPLVYLTSAVVLGCFGLAVVGAAGQGAIRRAGTAVIGLQAVLVVAYLVHLAVAAHPAFSRSAGRVLSGDLAPLFWFGVVVVGLLVPLALVRKPGRLSSTGAAVGLLCAFAGAVAFRMLMFTLGSSVWQFF